MRPMYVNRIDPKLARQNVGEPWVDCTRRRRPRPHRLAPAAVETAVGGVVHRYRRCTRCPVVVLEVSKG